MTNSSADIVEAYDTDAYGNTLIFTAPGTGGWFDNTATQGDQPACEYIFTGRQYDPETGNYFYRARYYNTWLGRFMSRDPINYQGSPLIRSVTVNSFNATGGAMGVSKAKIDAMMAKEKTGKTKRK